MADVVRLQLGAAQDTAHCQRPAVLVGMRLGERLYYLRSKRVPNKKGAPRLAHIRREDSAQLMGALNPIFDGIPVLAEARVCDGIASLTEGVS